MVEKWVRWKDCCYWVNTSIKVIENSFEKCWHGLWLECDFMLVVNVFQLCSQMKFVVSHIYREGNNCIDKFLSKINCMDKLSAFDFLLEIVLDGLFHLILF